MVIIIFNALGNYQMARLGQFRETNISWEPSFYLKTRIMKNLVDWHPLEIVKKLSKTVFKNLLHLKPSNFTYKPVN